jgi:hypothetical protein
VPEYRAQVNVNKIIPFVLCMLVAVSALAVAQDSPVDAQAPAPPSFCKPCLWYAGDFDPKNSKANVAPNERDLIVGRSVVYVPFTVPKGKIWNITGAFGVVLAEINLIDPPQADWSFSKDVSTGKAGKLIKSGTSRATVTKLGCDKGIALFCLGILVKGLKVTLPAGRYRLSVVPYCTNKNDSACDSQRFFLADVEDNPPMNHYGPKDVLDASYITSKDLGLYFDPTWGSTGECRGHGCDMFSAGLLGTSKTDDDFGNP